MSKTEDAAAKMAEAAKEYGEGSDEAWEALKDFVAANAEEEKDKK